MKDLIQENVASSVTTSLLCNNNLTMSETTQIKDYLRVLNLNTTWVPTFKEYKKAYRELLKLHHDLGGDTPKFQEITQAAREVFDYNSS